MKQNPIEMEVLRTGKPSEKEIRERGLRILARIIARRHIENARPKGVLGEGGHPPGGLEDGNV